MLLVSCGEFESSIEDKIAALGLVESQRLGNYGWREAGNRSYYVSTQSGDLEIKNYFPDIEREFPNYFENEYGEYIGSDEGEWGGELVFIDQSGSRSTIINGNILSIVPNEKSIYVLTGLNHLGLNTGTVFSIPNTANPKEIEEIIELPNKPVESIKFGNSILTIGSEEVTQISPTAKTLISNPWKGIYPTSAVTVDDSTILVGLWSGLALIRFDNNEPIVKVYVDPEYEL